MIRLYIINLTNTQYYNFAESVNISLYLKSLAKYSPLNINKDYLTFNINPQYDEIQTIVKTNEPFLFTYLIQLEFKQFHLHEGWFQFTDEVFKKVKQFIKPFIHTNQHTTITDDALYKCTICNKKTFNNTKSLNKHISECSNNFTCKICNKIFVNKTCYTNHTKNCNTPNCPTCHKTFSSKQALDRHLVNCGAFTCTNCHIVFNSKHKYISHCQNNHQFTPVI